MTMTCFVLECPKAPVHRPLKLKLHTRQGVGLFSERRLEVSDAVWCGVAV